MHLALKDVIAAAAAPAATMSFGGDAFSSSARTYFKLKARKIDIKGLYQRA